MPPSIRVTEIGEFISHRSCERRFKLSFNHRAEARRIPFAERLFNALDPVLQMEGRHREEQWESSLREAGLRDLIPQALRNQDSRPNWQDFLGEASRLAQGQSGYAREVRIEGVFGAFRVSGRIDFCTLRWIDGRPRIRLVECKASRRDRTYQRVQIGAYGLLARSLLSGHSVGGATLTPADVECVVARIDESTNRAQVILDLPPLDLGQEEADIRSLLNAGGTFDAIVGTQLDELDYQLDSKCDACVFSVHCYPESARRRRIQLIGVEPSAVRVLAGAGIRTIDELADVDLSGQEARVIRSTPGFSHSLTALKQRAHARRSTLPGGRDGDTYEVEPLPNSPSSQLPPHLIGNQRLVRVYLTVHYDYVENRIGAMSTHVTCSDGRSVTTWAKTDGRWHPEAGIREQIETDQAHANTTYQIRDLQGTDIVRWKSSPWTGRYEEDTGAEREMLQAFFQELIDAIADVARVPQAPIHFYVWSRSEMARLIEACSRVGSGLLGHLRELLGCRQPLDQLIFSCLEDEVHNRFALGWSGRGLAVASSLTWFGQRFHWRRCIYGQEFDLDRVFTQDIFDFKTELWLTDAGDWAQDRASGAISHRFEIRSRFHDTLTAPYWRAVWHTLPDPETITDGKIANAIRRYNRASERGVFRAYLAERAHALRWIEDGIRFKNAEITKPLITIEDLVQFTLGINTTAEAAIDYLRLDQHVSVTDWLAFHLIPPAYRVPAGRTLPLRDVRCTRRYGLAARIDLAGYDIDLTSLQTQCTIQEGSFVRLTPSNADPRRGQTVAQLLRLGSTCIIEELDWDSGNVTLSIVTR